jgi:hypothetical protein
MVGGSTPSVIARTEAIASTAPAAPSRWPVIDLVDDTGIRRASASPSAILMAAVSVASLASVEVPWALM